MSLSQEIVDSIIAKNNVNANERIYDALYDKAVDKIGMRKIELAQNMFATGNYESDDDYYEEGEEMIEYEDESEDEVPEDEYEQ